MIEPETVRQKFPLIDEPKFNELMAMYVVENSNAAFENFYYFAAIVLALNKIIPNFKMFEVPEIPQIWYAMAIIKKLRPSMELSEEVEQFIRIASNEAGYYIYPPECTNLYPSKYQKIAEELAENGPFPLGETIEEIQASKLLEIRNYLNRMNKNDNR